MKTIKGYLNEKFKSWGAVIKATNWPTKKEAGTQTAHIMIAAFILASVLSCFGAGIDAVFRVLFRI